MTAIAKLLPGAAAALLGLGLLTGCSAPADYNAKTAQELQSKVLTVTRHAADAEYGKAMKALVTLDDLVKFAASNGLLDAERSGDITAAITVVRADLEEKIAAGQKDGAAQDRHSDSGNGSERPAPSSPEGAPVPAPAPGEGSVPAPAPEPAPSTTPPPTAKPEPAPSTEPPGDGEQLPSPAPSEPVSDPEPEPSPPTEESTPAVPPEEQVPEPDPEQGAGAPPPSADTGDGSTGDGGS